MVDVLRSIGLVAHQKSALAEADVLDEDRIEGSRRGAGICCLQAPEPGGLAGMQQKLQAVADAAGFPFPRKASIAGAKSCAGICPCGLDSEGSLTGNSQINPANAITGRRAEQLVDEYWAIRVQVFNGEDAAVRKNADGKARLVLDPLQAEVTVAWCLPTAFASRHDRFPAPGEGRCGFAAPEKALA